MILVAMTGGIGSGKSTLAQVVEELGWVVIDADQLARQVVAKGTEGLEQVLDLLGPQVLGIDGELDRAQVAKIVFNDRALLAQLEAITHRRIAHEKKRLLRQLYTKDQNTKICYLVPLLFEKKLERHFAASVLVLVEPEEQRRRLVELRGMEASDVERRIQAQLPLEEKRARADWTIDNNGSLEVAQAQLKEVFGQLARLPQQSLEQVLGLA